MHFVRDLLSIARKDSGMEPLTLASVALEELTTKSLSHFQSAAGRVVLDIDPALAVMAEPNTLWMALTFNRAVHASFIPLEPVQTANVT